MHRSQFFCVCCPLHINSFLPLLVAGPPCLAAVCSYSTLAAKGCVKTLKQQRCRFARTCTTQSYNNAGPAGLAPCRGAAGGRSGVGRCAHQAACTACTHDTPHCRGAHSSARLQPCECIMQQQPPQLGGQRAVRRAAAGRAEAEATHCSAARSACRWAAGARPAPGTALPGRGLCARGCASSTLMLCA